MALVVLALGLWRWWVSLPNKPVDGWDPGTRRLLVDLLLLALSQALFVFAAVFGSGRATIGALLVVVSGVAATWVLIDLARKKRNAQDQEWSIRLTVAMAVLLTVVGTMAIALELPDLQFLVAVVCACVVPFESTPSIS